MKMHNAVCGDQCNFAAPLLVHAVNLQNKRNETKDWQIN